MGRPSLPSFEAVPPSLVEALCRAAELAALLASARAVLAGFRQEIDDGRLRPPQHASLLLLEEALTPFAGNSGAHAPEGEAGGDRRAPACTPGPAIDNAVGKAGGFCPECGAPNYGGPDERRRRMRSVA